MTQLTSPCAVQWQGSGSSLPHQLLLLFYFRAGDHWWWVPITAPTLGSLAGVLIHKLFIDFHNQPNPKSGNEKGQTVVETSTL